MLVESNEGIEYNVPRGRVELDYPRRVGLAKSQLGRGPLVHGTLEGREIRD